MSRLDPDWEKSFRSLERPSVVQRPRAVGGPRGRRSEQDPGEDGAGEESGRRGEEFEENRDRSGGTRLSF